MWNPENSAEEVLVMVCRTGLNTAMGSTIRELLVPAKVTKRDPVVTVCSADMLVCLPAYSLLLTHALSKCSG